MASAASPLPAPPPPPVETPQAAGARPVLLREWSYPPTPVAVAVNHVDDDQDSEPPEQDQNQQTNDGQNEQQDQTTGHDDDQQEEQPQYPVATFVGTLAYNIRSSIDQWIAEQGNEGNLPPGAPTPVVPKPAESQQQQHDNEESVRSVASSLQGQQQQQFGSCAAGDSLRSSGTAVEGESLRSVSTAYYFGDKEESVEFDSAGGASAPFDGIDEAEFVIVDGELIGVPIPPPTQEEMDGIESNLRHPSGAGKRNCGVHGVRKGVGRVRKWMKNRRHARREKMEARRERKAEDNLGEAMERDGQEVVPMPGPAPDAPLAPLTASEREYMESRGRWKKGKNRRQAKKKRRWSGANDTRAEDSASDGPSNRSVITTTTRRVIPAPAAAAAGQCVTETTTTTTSGSSAIIPPPPQAFLIAQPRYDESGRYLLPPGTPAHHSVDPYEAALAEKVFENDPAARKAAENDMLMKKRPASLDESKNVGSSVAIKEEEQVGSDLASPCPCSLSSSGSSLSSSSSSWGQQQLSHVQDSFLKEITDAIEDDIIHEDFEGGAAPQSTKIELSEMPDLSLEEKGAEPKVIVPCERQQAAICSPAVHKLPSSDEEGHVYNDTVKIVVVGAPGSGKSSLVRLLKEKRTTTGDGAATPKPKKKSYRKKNALGVDVHTWAPSVPDAEEQKGKGRDANTNVKFSIWDLDGGSGQGAAGARRDGGFRAAHHATQSLFFSPDSLYVIVWDMGASNPSTQRRRHRTSTLSERSDDLLSDHSEDEEDEDDEFLLEQQNRAADAALEQDVDNNVLFWVESIRRKAGGDGAAILPVATFGDALPDGEEEAQRRCRVLRDRLLRHYRMQERQEDGEKLPLPELILDEGGEVARASSSSVDNLRETILGAVGSEGHHRNNFGKRVGRRVPTLSVKVHETVRNLKRDQHKVVTISHVVSDVQDRFGIGVHVDDVREALGFLSSIGQVLYFGGSTALGDDPAVSSPLSEFVILSQKWLVSAVSCIVRPDLKREIVETRRFMTMQMMYSAAERQKETAAAPPQSFLGDNSNCPVVTSGDASMLWQSMNFMREAADRITRTSSCSLFQFLETLLVHAGVFVPLGGEDPINLLNTVPDAKTSQGKGELYLLPSLIASEEPTDGAWTYKSSDSWMTTLSHSWLFPDAVPSGLMEVVTVSVLKDLYGYTRSQVEQFPPQLHRTQSFPLETKVKRDLFAQHEDHTFGKMRVREVTCWKSALLVKVGVLFLESETQTLRESECEIFVHLVQQPSRHCVASSSMGPAMTRLLVSGKGQVGNHGRKLWKGGYGIVLDSIGRLMKRLRGGSDTLAVEREVICPDCLAQLHPTDANKWSLDSVVASAVAAARGGGSKGRVRCERGHDVDANILCGFVPERSFSSCCGVSRDLDDERCDEVESGVCKPISSLLGSVVVVALWDGRARQIRNVGSGFVVDKKRGLIVTASHNLFDMAEGKNFGRPYFGLKDAKAVIGIIPQPDDVDSDDHRGTTKEKEKPVRTVAVFRYFAEIVAEDVRNVDACVLRITTRLERDVEGEGEGCGDQPEIPLVNDVEAMKGEKLQQLRMTRKCELEEAVRIIGYNQGGEGLLEPGKHVNRCADFSRGYVCKKFKALPDDGTDLEDVSGGGGGGLMSLQQMKLMARSFSPREEIVAMCPTIGGHSGGPCVNQEGNVIGVLSRADPADKQRCYLVPAAELRGLVKKARARCARGYP